MAEVTMSSPLHSINFILIYLVILSGGLGNFVHSKEKCSEAILKAALNYTGSFPEVRVLKKVPVAAGRSVVEHEKPPPPTIKNTTGGNSTVKIPNSLELLSLECSANYKVQWGFESYPWNTFDTWTGVVRSSEENSTELCTATLVFYKLQETSLQTRTPICYSVQNPCIQTAVESRSGSNHVDLTIENGSSFKIRSESEKEKFGGNANCTLKFGYDPVSQKFYCQETDPVRASVPGKIFLRPCQDPVTCDSLIVDSNCTLEPSFPISECTIENRCRSETAVRGKFPGVAVCHSGLGPEHSAAIPYFYSFAPLNSSSNRTKRYLNWKNVDANEMLQVTPVDQPVFTHEKLSLLCNASYYFLGTGMYFNLARKGEDDPALAWGKNSTVQFEKKRVDLSREKNELEMATEVVKYDDANISGVGSKLPLVRSLELSDFVFETPGTFDLECYAPVWNATTWAKSVTTVTVKESVIPEFDGGNMTVKQYYAPNKRLECFAYGQPKPELTWTRDGGTIPGDISLVTGEQNQTLVWAILTFPKLEFGINGNFTCSASNVAGTASKTFLIIPPDKNSSTILWILVGLALLITVLIPLILFLSWKVRRQRQHIDDLTQEEVDEFRNGRPDYIPFHCDMSTYAYYLPYNTDYEIPRESLDIDFERILGSGEYGLVVYALYKNANPSNGGAPYVKPVAVKTTKPLTNGKEYFKALLSELKIMTYIGSHKNIVNLIGACTQNINRREVYIATEFCENGSLLAYLRSNRYAFENLCYYTECAPRSSLSSSVTGASIIFTDGIKPGACDVQYVKMEDLGTIVMSPDYQNVRTIRLQDLLKWACEIACGMEFLASKKVIHGDLAARNVLLTKSYIAKIGDFGLSRQLYHYSYYTKTAVTPLPLKWLAIECLQNFHFSVESDVWAYGVTLFELFSMGEIPYSSVQMNGEEFLRALKQGMRLSKPAYAPVDVFDLMLRCWKHDKKQRPTFTDIIKYFVTRDLTLVKDNMAVVADNHTSTNDSPPGLSRGNSDPRATTGQSESGDSAENYDMLTSDYSKSSRNS